jgi:hypothetical protein
MGYPWILFNLVSYNSNRLVRLLRDLGQCLQSLVSNCNQNRLSNAEKLTSRFWLLNRKSNGSFQVSFVFKSLSKNREVIFCVRLRKLGTI